jgi:hypothetical protein
LFVSITYHRSFCLFPYYFFRQDPYAGPVVGVEHTVFPVSESSNTVFFPAFYSEIHLFFFWQAEFLPEDFTLSLVSSVDSLVPGNQVL